MTSSAFYDLTMSDFMGKIVAKIMIKDIFFQNEYGTDRFC